MRHLTCYSVAALILIGVPTGAAAQAPAPVQLSTPAPGPKTPDNVFFSGQTPVAGDSSSRGAGIEWLHPVKTTSALQSGAFLGSSAGGWYAYGRVGGMVRLLSTTVAGAVDLGGGSEGDHQFAYTRGRGELTVPTGLAALLAQAEVDHIRLATSVSTGLRLGAVYQLTPRLSLRANAHGYLSAYESVYEESDAIIHESGYVLNPAGSVRADYSAVKWGVLAGLFVAKRPTLISNAVYLAPSMHATRTTFVGMQVRVGAQDLVGVVDVSEQPSGSVTTLMVSVKVPLQ
jgi:hypothetical protein